MELLIQDLKHAFRMFRQNRAFTAAAVAALALGIGANTAIFSVVSAVLLKPVPFPDPDRVVLFMNTCRKARVPPRHRRSLRMAATDHRHPGRDGVPHQRRQLHGGQFPEQLRAGEVSATISVCLARVVMGRTFTADEDRPGGEKVAVLSHGLWTRRFSADAGIIGRTISERRSPRRHRCHWTGVRHCRVRTGARPLDPVPT